MRASLLLLAFIISANIQGQSGRTLKQRCRNLLDSMAREHQFSGVLLVADGQKTVYYGATGYRDFANAIKLNKTDIFELASLSKQFTAMIIMMLKEEGRLDFDDAVNKYLDVPYQGITIRHLLNHSSGLPDYQEIMDKHWDKTRVAGNEDAIEYLVRYAPPALFEPGTKYEYSNTGYLLLASIAEKASGTDFIEMCRNRIFRPLDMKSTDIRSNEVKKATPNFAIGHIWVSEKKRHIRADSFPSSDYTIWLGNRKGPGRISSTAKDLRKWDLALYSGKLVSKETLAQAFMPAELKNGTMSHYGFGWDLAQHPRLGRLVSHTGDNPGYRTRIRRYIDRKITIILLNNNESTKMDSMMDQLLTLMPD